MLIHCLSDLHGYLPDMPEGDMLIVAGDVTAKHTIPEFEKFLKWIREQKYKWKIFVAGNHDTFLDDGITIDVLHLMNSCCTYLFDSGTEIEGLKIWGSPWTATFHGQNPKCKAFSLDTEQQLERKWRLIPEGTDILVTHCPPWLVLDGGKGSKSLRTRVNDVRPKLHVFGHIHEARGATEIAGRKFVNSSHVNEYYEDVNHIISVYL